MNIPKKNVKILLKSIKHHETIYSKHVKTIENA